VLRRKHFLGAPEMAENFFRFVAEDVRGILASLGARSLGEIVGHTELLKRIDGVTVKQKQLDLQPLLAPLSHRDRGRGEGPGVTALPRSERTGTRPCGAPLLSRAGQFQGYFPSGGCAGSVMPTRLSRAISPSS